MSVRASTTDIDAPFDRFNLPAEPADAAEKLLIVTKVSHRWE
jgi:hypothetical protein